MKNLRILQDFAIGGIHTTAGTILENVENILAAELLTTGRAALATNEEIENRDPSPEHRDPKLAKANKAAKA